MLDAVHSLLAIFLVQTMLMPVQKNVGTMSIAPHPPLSKDMHSVAGLAFAPEEGDGDDDDDDDELWGSVDDDLFDDGDGHNDETRDLLLGDGDGVGSMDVHSSVGSMDEHLHRMVR